MRSLIRALGALTGIVCLMLWAPAALRAATIGASSDTSKPSASTSYMSGLTFNITENVAVDPNAGPWHKDLVATTGTASGQDRTIMEMLTNLGGIAWSDWHEAVLTRTTINMPNDAPGFLFRQGSLSVSANYGSGPVALSEGTDYTVTPTLYSGPGSSGNNGNWEAIDITLSPARFIAPGNTLSIQKNIFEVFLDGDTWMTGEAAQIGEYPTTSGVPEPAALGVTGVALAAFISGRRRRR
jgi:hypothetical protein